MEDQLIKILSTFGYPVFRQGSLSDDESYPDDFFTYWNEDSSDHSHYDNSEYGTNWSFRVYFYSINVNRAYSMLMEAKAKLKQAGWIVSGKGYDVASDEPTHTGRAIDAQYLET